MAAADRARARLVDGLRESGRLGGPGVEEAFREVPRHLFLPAVPLARAYADEAVAVQAVDGVTTSSASQPSMVAIMLGQLDLRPGHRVLEVGAGTGYNAALMRRIVGPGGRVVAVDIDAELVAGAGRHLAAAGVEGVELVCADGAFGFAPGAPYDRIVLTVGSGDIRPEWVTQLAPGGRLLLPLALRGTQLSVALDLGSDGVLRSDSVNRCAFVRLRGQAATPEPGAARAGLVVLPADVDGLDLPGVHAALAAPGGSRPMPTSLGAGDLWDGFGLWLALTQPGTCRFAGAPDGRDDAGDADDPGDPAAAVALLRLGPGHATVGLVGPADRPGVAACVLDPADGGARGRVRVQGFGPAGDDVVERVLTACAAWQAAGRPGAADLRLTVLPRGVAAPPAPSAPIVVVTEHCRVLVDFPPTGARSARS